MFPNSRCIGLDIDISIAERNMDNLLELGTYAMNSPELYRYDQLGDSTELLDEILNGDRIDIFIYDGAHFDATVMIKLKSAVPHLSDQSVCFVEDNANVTGKLNWNIRSLPIYVDSEHSVMNSS